MGYIKTPKRNKISRKRSIPKSIYLILHQICFYTMATVGAKSHDDKSLHEDEISKTPADPTLAIYLEFASQDSQWKDLHTKRLLRKVDWRLLPLLILMYLLNFLDRSNLAQARLGTLEKDLGMKGTDFNLATSILFVVCLVCNI
jgi:hypothetical protein